MHLKVQCPFVQEEALAMLEEEGFYPGANDGESVSTSGQASWQDTTSVQPEQGPEQADVDMWLGTLPGVEGVPEEQEMLDQMLVSMRCLRAPCVLSARKLDLRNPRG